MGIMNTESFNIILIKDLIDSKKRKEEELKFYKEKLKELQTRIGFLHHEVHLTNTIIMLIEQENIKEI